MKMSPYSDDMTNELGGMRVTHFTLTPQLERCSHKSGWSKGNVLENCALGNGIGNGNSVALFTLSLGAITTNHYHIEAMHCLGGKENRDGIRSGEPRSVFTLRYASSIHFNARERNLSSYLPFFSSLLALPS